MQETYAVEKCETNVKKRESFIPLELRPDLNVYVNPKVNNKEVHEKDTADRSS